MKTFLLLFLVLFFSWITSAYWVSEEIIIWDSQQTNTTNKTLQEQISDKKKEIFSLADESDEEKDITYLEWLIDDVQIKKNVSTDTVIVIKEEIASLKENIEKNKQTVEQLSSQSNQLNSNLQNELDNAEMAIQKYENDLWLKEHMIENLETTIEGYEILEKKYDVLLEEYTQLKKQLTDQTTEENQWKFYYFLIIIFIAIAVYSGKTFLLKKFPNKYEEKFIYFDLLYGIFFVLVLVLYSFSIFPQLYLVMIFVASSIVIVLGHFISSFVWSFLLLRKYKIWDIVIFGDFTWKIIWMSPTHSSLRIINNHGYLTNRILNFSNDAMVKEKVIRIETENIRWHDFQIIFKITPSLNYFKIVDEIEESVLSKAFFPKTKKVDPDDNDMYKVNFTQEKHDEVIVHFYWRTDILSSRRLEKQILWISKRHLDQLEQISK